MVADAETLRGAQIWLDFPSVGATENILMAAVLADGTTVIDNAAREPEIVDLVTMLQQMGAKIEGARHVDAHRPRRRGAARPTSHRVLGDRIVGATWGFAAAMAGGDVTVRGVDPHHLDLVLDRLAPGGRRGQRAGRGLPGRHGRAVRARSTGVTLPYPGFATDLQPMAIALSAISEGTSMITENVFEGRFRFVEEMVRLGADARTDGHHAVVRGVRRLSSAPVWASDIRAGAGLVLAGLCADGETEVWDVAHIDRGYPLFVENLAALGGGIHRVVAPPVR